MFYRIKKLYLDNLRRFIGDWRYFLYDEHKKENMLIKDYYHTNSKCHNKQPLAIYLANGLSDHAGLSDRFKGMTAIYGWCKQNSMAFRISHTFPFELSDYLVPNKYDWRIAQNELCYNNRWTSVNYAMLNNLVRKQIDSGEIVLLESAWLDRRLKRKKMQHHFYTNFYPESDQAFGLYFHELFKPSPRLQANIEEHLHHIGGDYISISFRFVQLLGDFRDCDGETLPINQQQDLIKRSIKVVETIKSLHPTINHILITADSALFLEAVRFLPYTYVVDGKIGHIKYEQSDDVNIKTFLDFLLITNAQKVYLAKSEKMYNSDFAHRAAMINNRPFELFLY